MHQEQRQRMHDLLRSHDLEYALFANYNTVRWLTGFAPPMQTGPNFFAGGPALVWYAAGSWTLLVLDGHAVNTYDFANDPGCELRTYLGYTIEQPLNGPGNLANVLSEIVASSATNVVGIEHHDLTARQLATLTTARPNAGITQIDGWAEPLRMIKTAEELVKLRENFALIDYGHQIAREVVKPGMREIDVWAEVHSAIQRRVGQRVPFGNDCVIGYREQNIGGWPLDYELRPHDSLVLDISTIRHGYWSDSCNTYYADGPTDRQIALHHTVEAALDFGISLLRPGAVAREIDQQIRRFLTDRGHPPYPHHTGHGVGVSGHEWPRIVPYCDDQLAAGMVILLEPGIYYPRDTSVRLEHAMLITETGSEMITTFEHRLR